MKRKNVKTKVMALTICIMILVVTTGIVIAEDDGSGPQVEQPQVVSLSPQGVQPLQVPLSISGATYTAYASWDDDDDRNEGYVYIYPLQDGTNITLYYTSSTAAPIQINLVANTWTNVGAGVPLQYGPLTNQQYFFKLVSNKPVSWELITENYAGVREASRFVTSDQLNYKGTSFYFHADQETYEKIYVINPGPGNSGTVTLYRWTTTWTTVTSTSNINPDAFWSTSVPLRGFYKIESENPVLVYEGRLYNQNMATGVTAEGDTVGNIVYCVVPHDSFVGSSGGVTLHVMGVTSADYTVYRNTGVGWTSVTSASVVAGSCTTHANLLPMDAIYKIVTSSEDQKIFVQYLTAWTSDTARGGAEMIPGIDGGDTTNPGTQFYLYFDAGGSYSYQKYIDVLMPESGTNVGISGPVSTTFTSTVNDEAYHWAPGDGNAGMYTVTSTKPVYVVVMSELGDQQGYFVYSPVAVPEVVEVSIDIKPGSCPNPLKKQSKGVLPVAVLGTEDFDVTTIDPSTIQLTREGFEDVGVSPIRWSYEDVATPFEGELCDCHELEGDGILDLTLKFNTQELVETLGLSDEAGNTIPLTLTGNLKEEFDGTLIKGEDCIWVLEPR